MIYRSVKGGVDENFEFTMGPDTSAYHSCSATLNDELFVFGGSETSYNKQVIFRIRKTIKLTNYFRSVRLTTVH